MSSTEPLVQVFHALDRNDSVGSQKLRLEAPLQLRGHACRKWWKENEDRLASQGTIEG